MNIQGPVIEGAAGDTMRRQIRASRSLLFMLTGALMTAACGGGGVAPVVERSTAGSSSGQSTGVSGGSAAPEISDGDWTATVRPLGDPGSTASRELPTTAGTQEVEQRRERLPTTAGMQEVEQRRERLPSEEPVTAAAPTAGPAPASSGGSQAPVPASSGAGRAAAPASGASSSAANPAVVSLLNTASAQSRAGDHARAAATLERAIAIESNNAWLWHRLAGTRLAEGRLDQATSLAAKSNSLATADRSLQADNWKLIAEARRRQGDTVAAAAAEAQAARLSN